ncbi:MAG: phosphoglycerate mutase family protein, partial [Alphaproteobacteria bacterium]
MVISSLNLIEIWEKAGATINPVGSFRIGVLAKHRDIDFHIYTDSLD